MAAAELTRAWERSRYHQRLMTLVQTGKAKPVPIVLCGTAFWKKLINFEALVEEGTISAQDLKLFHYTDDPQEAWELIKSFYQL